MDEEELDERESTLRQANQQAEERSLLHAAAHEQRLAELAREVYTQPVSAHYGAAPSTVDSLTPSLAAHHLADYGDEVPEELPHAAAAHPDHSGGGWEACAAAEHAGGHGVAAHGGGNGGGPRSLGNMRHAALQEKCRQLLGEAFPPVYDYLRTARANEAEEKDVRRTLLSLVGPKRLNDCMCVDELIFVESNF